MAKSIIQEDREHCFICGRNSHADYFGLEEHHVFGAANKKKSEKYGLKIYICGARCHREGPESVHKNANVDRSVKRVVQKRAMQYYGWTVDEWREKMGKNYL